MTDLIARLS